MQKTVLGIIITFLIPAITFAELLNPLNGINGIGDLLIAISKTIAYVAVPVLALALVWVGFKFVSAQGNTDKLKEARTMFMYTVIAAVLVLGAPLIIEMLKSIAQQITR